MCVKYIHTCLCVCLRVCLCVCGCVGPLFIHTHVWLRKHPPPGAPLFSVNCIYILYLLFLFFPIDYLKYDRFMSGYIYAAITIMVNI